MRIYLAAAYQRRAEMLNYRDQLEQLGHQVVSGWINGSHEAEDSRINDPDYRTESAAFAHEDIMDMQIADCIISFTNGGPARGGHHVEFGYGLALRKSMVVVGPIEHVFHTLPEVTVLKSWAECLYAIGKAVRK